jgi:hypothetical protein
MKVHELVELLLKENKDQEVYFASPGVDYRLVKVGIGKKGQGYDPSSTGDPHFKLPDRVVLVGEVVT